MRILLQLRYGRYFRNGAKRLSPVSSLILQGPINVATCACPDPVASREPSADILFVNTAICDAPTIK